LAPGSLDAVAGTMLGTSSGKEGTPSMSCFVFVRDVRFFGKANASMWPLQTRTPLLSLQRLRAVLASHDY
jgi:hypothetical protein